MAAHPLRLERQPASLSLPGDPFAAQFRLCGNDHCCTTIAVQAVQEWRKGGLANKGWQSRYKYE